MYRRHLSAVLLAAACGAPAVCSPAQAPAAGGHLIEFDAPGAATTVSSACGSYCGTFAYANNDEGTVVGTFTDEYVVPHGFLRSSDGQFVIFDAPGAGLGQGLDEGTVPYTINDYGVVAGQYQDRNLRFHAFIRYPDGTEFDPPGSVGTIVCEETCLNAEGSAVGFYIDANATIHGFLRLSSGAITVIAAPGAGTGNFTGTVAASITEDGEIGGYFVDSNGVYHGFVLQCDGRFASFEVPPAYLGAGAGTAPFAIDIWGVTTGIYIDSSSVEHGFSRTSRGHVATFDAPGAGSGAGQGTRPSTNNIAGDVAGWYVDSTGLNHGFVWKP